jgi:hypothetical protein
MHFLKRYVVRPYIWCELPMWGWLFEQFVGDYRRDAEWANESPQVVRGKLHGYEMELDLAHWSARETCFLGRWQVCSKRCAHTGRSS